MRYFVEAFDYTLLNGVTGECNTEIIVCSSDQGIHGIFTIIIDIVSANVNVLELHILKEDPALNFGTLAVCIGCLLNQVK
jgi:hypothetical protein